MLFLEAPFEKKVKLCLATLDYLKQKKYKTVALFTSVQFVNNLNQVKRQLEQHKIKFITSQSARTHQKGQLLGCNVYLTLTEEADCYLYVGDGRFHPLALVYSQKNEKEIKEVICNDPFQEKMSLLSVKDVRTTLKKYRGSLLKFLSSQSIGVIVTIKPGQEHLNSALKLEEKYPNKKFYYFLDDSVSFNQLENFNFIHFWINTACPRIALDDLDRFNKGIINLNDAFSAEKILSQDSLFNNL